MNFINKYENDIFTNGDEIFIKIFARQVETILSSCNVFSIAISKTVLLSSLLRASVNLAATIPLKADGFLSFRPVSIGKVLSILESVTRDALKCFKVRAFLVTSPFIGLESGGLLYLKQNRRSSQQDIQTIQCGHEGVGGVAGNVAQTLGIYILIHIFIYIYLCIYVYIYIYTYVYVYRLDPA
jgi:hypothetical protein